MNTQLIQDIILSVLEDNDGCTMDNSQEREQVAEKVALALTLASLEQLAMLMGTSLEYDNDGHAIIYTGIQNPDMDRNVMQRHDLFDTFGSNPDINPTEVP